MILAFNISSVNMQHFLPSCNNVPIQQINKQILDISNLELRSLLNTGIVNLLFFHHNRRRRDAR